MLPDILLYVVILIFGVPAIVQGRDSPSEQPQLTEEKRCVPPEIISADRYEHERIQRLLLECIIGELKDADEHVRREAAARLGLIGPKAKDLCPHSFKHSETRMQAFAGML